MLDAYSLNYLKRLLNKTQIKFSWILLKGNNYNVIQYIHATKRFLIGSSVNDYLITSNMYKSPCTVHHNFLMSGIYFVKLWLLVYDK